MARQLYPESRECRYPTAPRIIDLLANHRRHVLINNGKPVKCFHDNLSSIIRDRATVARYFQSSLSSRMIAFKKSGKVVF